MGKESWNGKGKIDLNMEYKSADTSLINKHGVGEHSFGK